MITKEKVLADFQKCLVEIEASEDQQTRWAEMASEAYDIAGEIFPGRVVDGPPTQDMDAGVMVLVSRTGQSYIRCHHVIEIEPPSDENPAGTYRYEDGPGTILAVSPYPAA